MHKNNSNVVIAENKLLINSCLFRFKKKIFFVTNCASVNSTADCGMINIDVTI